MVYDFLLNLHSMNYVILAAGQGSRLKGVAPKPLVEVGGKSLLLRLLDIIGDDACVTVVANAAVPEIAASLPASVRVIEANTPSAAHSLHLATHPDDGAPVVAITVDSFFSEEAFRKFAEAFEQTDADALMGVTSYIDDEAPLYVKAENGRISAFSDFPDSGIVSAGVYGLKPKALAVVDEAIEKGVNGLRELQRALLLRNLDVRAFDMGMVIDIDRPEDLEIARKL